LKKSHIRLFSTLKGYNIKYLPKDILTGIIIAAVSIPISMGYAQIAGLPAVYGLYGSVFPIIVFAIFSTSPQFIFGVDAAPAALVGAELMTMGIEAGSDEALAIVPLITFFTAVWLFVFYLFKAGKLVNYISTPVMGGFITGICTTIILMQIPKLMGGSAGTGEFFELMAHIIKTVPKLNRVSLLLGLGTLAVLIISKKLIPKFPMVIVVMAAGALMSAKLNLADYGVTMLDAVATGLPKFKLPDYTVYSSYSIENIAGLSLSVAVVIMAETLLAENSFAQKNDYRLNDNQEILAFAMGNLVAAFTGCTPINGSVSRTTMSEQYGGKTQLTGIVAGLAMMILLLFGTGFIAYLPVPVLTAIVINALMGALEFHLAGKLFKTSRMEFYIFVGAFLGVLFLGTIYGVIIGIILSFANVIIRAATPPRCFLGVLPGHTGFLDISRFKHVYPIEHVVIYRFSSNLFFANVNTFQKDIEDSIKEDTKAVILDASAIGSLDVTAAERLELIYKKLKARGIRFYMTEHIAEVNVELRALGLTYMIEEGAVRRTVELALSDMGIRKPYPVGNHKTNHLLVRKGVENTIQEFVWAYGDDAEAAIERQLLKEIERLRENGNADKLLQRKMQKLKDMGADRWLKEKHPDLYEKIKKLENE
jgi:high affinity sulfate transporter 1